MHARPFAAFSTGAVRTQAWLTPLELFLLGAIWGASFLFMRVAAPDLGVVPLVTSRLGLGALALSPCLWFYREAFPVRTWARVTAIGLINSALPFMLFTWAAQRAPAGVGAITCGATMLFASLVGCLFFGEKLSARRALALCVGFAGVLVLASGKVAGASVGPAAMAGVAAAFLYGLGGHLAHRHLGHLPAAGVAGATLLTSALLMLPWALATWPKAAVPLQSWAATAALGVLCTGLAYVPYYRLIARVGASRTAAVTYLIPLFGVAWSWLVLGEPPTPSMGLAGLLILSGVWLGQREQTDPSLPTPSAADDGATLR